MATIQNRGPYQWRVQIRKKGFPPQTKTFDTKSDAEMWARSIENEMDRGIFVSQKKAESTTLLECLERYRDEVSSKKKSHEIEKVYIKTLSNCALAQLFMSQVGGESVAKYRDERLEKVSRTAVRHELSLLSHLFTIATKEWGMTGLVNPVSQIRRPAPNKSRDRRPTEEEIDLLIESSPESLKNIVLFALETGMRRGEIVGMTWDLVDLKKRTVTLPETKNGEKRIVPLSTEAVRILSVLERKSDKVWTLQAPNSITHAFKDACKAAGIEDLNFHDLRHEATSRFFEKGLNPMQVAAITGHKTLQMLKRYTHLKAEDLAELLK